MEYYRDTLLRSIRVAQHLQIREINSSDVVILITYNTLESCLPYLACLFLDVKICAVDPSLPAEDLSHCFKVVEPRFVFCIEECLKTIEKALTKAFIDTQLVVMGESKTFIQFSEFLETTGIEDEFQPKVIDDVFDTVALIFSSGTSGKPKAMCATHFGLNSKEVMLVFFFIMQ